MKNQVITSEKMTLICNIQALRSKVHPDTYKPHQHFELLSFLTVDRLRTLQDTWVSIYNRELQKNQLI